MLFDGWISARECWDLPVVAPGTLATMIAASARFLCCCSVQLLLGLLLVCGSLHSGEHCETHTLFVRRTGWLVLPMVFDRFVDCAIVLGSNMAVAESIVPCAFRAS